MYREAFIAIHNGLSKDSKIKKKKTFTQFLKTEHSLNCWTLPVLFLRICVISSQEILIKQDGSTAASMHTETSKYNKKPVLFLLGKDNELFKHKL